MNELQNFTNGIFNLDVKVEGEEVLFSAEQVAKSLGLTQKQNKSGKIYESIRWETINKYLPQLSGEIEKGSFISEPMVYKLAFKANNAVSEKFTDWLAVEVLPTIRKHGAYMTDAKAQDVISGNGLADLLLQAGNQIKQLELEKSQMKPKALFADSVASSHTSILVGELAKILRSNGVNIGANRLFEWLRNNGYLIKRNGSDRNMPTQKSMDLGLFEIKEGTRLHADGSIAVTKTSKVTGKGQIYFVNKFLQDVAQKGLVNMATKQTNLNPTVTFWSEGKTNSMNQEQFDNWKKKTPWPNDSLKILVDAALSRKESKKEIA